MNRLMGIITYRCNDSGFNDFPESFYSEAMLFAQRKVARQYSLLNRHYTFNAKGSDLTKPLDLKLHSFQAETMVLINGKEYRRGNNLRFEKDRDLQLNNLEFGTNTFSEEINDKEYQLYFGTQNYLFNYYPRSEEDQIDLFYTADITIDDFDDESVTPIISSRYDEEVIKYSLLYVAEAGIGRFQGAKKEKYLSIYKLNSGKRDGTESGEKETFPTIQVFKVI